MSFRGTAGPIPTVQKLAGALRLEPSHLYAVAKRADSVNYRAVSAPAKKNGQPREVYSPSRDMRVIQRRLVEVFFKNPQVINWPPFIYGGIHRDALPPGDTRDHVACAAKHCGSKSLLKLDIEDFYGSVNYILVERIFSDMLKWGASPSELAAKLCTRDNRLPQGGITSSYLSLLCLYDLEPKLIKTLEYKSLIYTRYVDDITISSRAAHYDFKKISRLVENTFAPKGLFLNSSKADHQVMGLEALCIHGLNVAFERPVLPKAEVKRIKSVCKQTVLEATESGRRSHLYRRRYFRAMGLVNKLARVGSSSHRKYVLKLRKVAPLPAYLDYVIATDVAFNLRASFDQKKTTYWYKRRFSVLMARLDLIGVENKSWANNLRRYMKSHFKPEFGKK